MSRLYSVPVTGTYTAAGTDVDLLTILPADDKPCQLVGWSMGQHSEFGDAAEENVRITVRHMTATVTNGSGGATVTPVNVDDPAGGQAAGFTARTLDTTVATTSGTSTIVENRAWNERATPWEWIYPDERFYPKCRQGEAIIVRGETTVADDVSVDYTFWILEN